jgi:hypothetical protein
MRPRMQRRQFRPTAWPHNVSGLLQIEWVIFAILRAISVFDGDAIADW